MNIRPARFPLSAAERGMEIPAWLGESPLLAVFIVQADGIIEFANEVFRRATGFTEASDLIGTSFERLLFAQSENEQFWHECYGLTALDLHLADRHGSPVTLHGQVNPLDEDRILGLFIVDRFGVRRFETLMQHAARMEAVAAMSTGIAHDFNNLLTVLVGNLYLVGEEVRSDAVLYDRIKTARDAARRGADLTRQLLNFARRDAVDAGSTSVGAVIERLEPLLTTLAGPGIALQLNVSNCPDIVATAAAQIESALINLVTNARDALAGSGSIRISLYPEPRSMTDDTHENGLPGVVVEVSDNGSGMPDAVRARAFDAFYTTKGPDRGTGLGLCMVRWLCEELGGHVRLHSVAGRGTTVAMHMPVSADPLDETISRTMPLSILPSGDETVMVCLQERELRSMVTQTLEVLGYEVRVATEGQPVLDLIADRPINLLISDAVAEVPQRDLLMGSRNPGHEFAILFLSVQAVPDNLTAAAGFLAPPFALADLATAVRRILDRALS